MSPTILFRAGQFFLATGSQGAGRIINAVLQVIVNIVDHGMDLACATAAPRFHHQWMPDVLALEQGFGPDIERSLVQLNYQVEIGDSIGSTQTIMRSGNKLLGQSDYRAPDGLAEGC
jgi:gamma-glutamyltranspeptidase/glutathione hydrolase